MFKKEIRGCIWTFIFLSLGGLLLHYRIHPPSKSIENYIPFICGIVTTFILPFMFNSEKTAGLAYIINIVVVIVGILTMAHFSVAHWDTAKNPVTIKNIIFKSTLPDIIILASKIPLGNAILRFYRNK